MPIHKAWEGALKSLGVKKKRRFTERFRKRPMGNQKRFLKSVRKKYSDVEHEAKSLKKTTGKDAITMITKRSGFSRNSAKLRLALAKNQIAMLEKRLGNLDKVMKSVVVDFDPKREGLQTKLEKTSSKIARMLESSRHAVKAGLDRES